MSDDLLKRLRRIWPEAPVTESEEVTGAHEVKQPRRRGSDSQERTCVVCGTVPPETDSEYTLISAQHGWRLTRTVTPDGKNRLDWRCPACWAKHRGATK